MKRKQPRNRSRERHTDLSVGSSSQRAAASVRAPLTGIVLAIEMTGRGHLSLAMLSAALGAMVVAMLLKSAPIYESLRLRMLERERQTQETTSTHT